MVPVLVTGALVLDVCVMLPTTGMPPVSVPLMLLDENDAAEPVALMLAELPTPESGPEAIVPVLVTAAALPPYWLTAPTVLIAPLAVLPANEPRTSRRSR